jgi:protein phosphatase 2C family protein 2/3
LLKCRLEAGHGLVAETAGGLMPDYEPSRHSKDANGLIQAYAANTNQGIVRNYNEDRVAIILNIKRPETVKEDRWKKCSFFGVYDGHGGTATADFLRDSLHQLIVRDPSFGDKPLEAIKSGFARAEQQIIENAQRQATGVL